MRIKKPAACPASAPPTSSSSLPTDCCSARARVSSSPPLEEDPEYSYLRTVLERGGFMRSSPPRRRPGRGHSVASPVDPIVFHLLELELPADEARLGPLRHRWNRKLLFHLAQELLADLLLGLDASSPTTTGLPLLGKVWRKVRSFPAADCRWRREDEVLKRAAHVLRPPRWCCHVVWRPRRMGNWSAVNNLTSSGIHFPRL